MPNMQCDLTVILVSYNTEHLLEECFDALHSAAQGITLQICVVDNASTDGSVDSLRTKYKVDHLIINEKNIGFGRANNQCLPLISSEFILLLNVDAFVSAQSLVKTLEYMSRQPECGVVGVKLVDRDGRLQPSCRYFPTPWNRFIQRTGLCRLMPNVKLMDDMTWGHAEVRKCDWVPGCYYLTRREVIDQVGLFDHRYFMYYEEIDHCYAVKKAGWQVHYYPYTEVIHLGGESAKSDGQMAESGMQIDVLQIESEMLYFRKNEGFWAVLLNNILRSLSDIIIPTRRLFRMRYPFYYMRGLKRIKIVWKLFIRTRWATEATR